MYGVAAVTEHAAGAKSLGLASEFSLATLAPAVLASSAVLAARVMRTDVSLRLRMTPRFWKAIRLNMYREISHTLPLDRLVRLRMNSCRMPGAVDEAAPAGGVSCTPGARQ